MKTVSDSMKFCLIQFLYENPHILEKITNVLKSLPIILSMHRVGTVLMIRKAKIIREKFSALCISSRAEEFIVLGGNHLWTF